MAHPVESGPQACLIEVTNPKNHVIETVDALIIVPGQAASGTDSLADPLYACWLGVIKNYYKTDRNKFLRSLIMQALAEKAETDHPSRPARQSGLYENAAQLLKSGRWRMVLLHRISPLKLGWRSRKAWRGREFGTPSPSEPV